MSNLSFAGETVLVTRPLEQAKKTIQLFEKRGARVVHLPLIEIVDPSDSFKALDRAIAQLEDYDWLIFTSQNAVLRFFSRMSASAAHELTVRIAAVGPSTAGLLRRLDVLDLIESDEPSAEGLLKTLEQYEMSGKRVLFPRAKEGRELIVDELQERGAEIEVVEVYQTMPPVDLDRHKLISLLQEGSLDAVHFASPSAVNHFFQIVEEEDIRSQLDGIQFLVVGSTTAEALKHYNRSGKIF